MLRNLKPLHLRDQFAITTGSIVITHRHQPEFKTELPSKDRTRFGVIVNFSQAPSHRSRKRSKCHIPLRKKTVMKIEILCTGDEILTGKTINTNYAYMAQRLTEKALSVTWGTVVGDDREDLTTAFLQAAERADAVIVNGGLGPTVDDLSQEVAAETAGVELELHEPWLENLKQYYSGRGRKMPENNVTQAMLPAGSEFIDNPIGTACGFAIDINKARFFFTPGVPREMRRMVDEQIIPRLLKLSGSQMVTSLKRFHTFGIGESRADLMLKDTIDPALEKSGAVKLGFQSHYPQLETKLSVQAKNQSELEHTLKPIEAEVRRKLGNFILCEDKDTLESIIIDKLLGSNHSLSCMEMTTSGAIATRLMHQDKGASVVQQCVVSPHLQTLYQSTGKPSPTGSSEVITTDTAIALSTALKQQSGSDYALTVLTAIEASEDSERSMLKICIGIAGPEGNSQRLALLPGRSGWARTGAVELSLDCLRRYLYGLPVDEKIDFEQQ